MRNVFKNRTDAGEQLASKLDHYRDDTGVVVLALPRGGVVPGAIVARELHAPFGAVLVRKIGHPSWPEYAVGAVAENDEPLYDSKQRARLDSAWCEAAESAARKLIEKRRVQYYADGAPPPSIQGKTVIVVDDGIATGLTMKAALRYVHTQQPKRVIVAAAVASEEAMYDLHTQADDVIVLVDPREFKGSVGAHYLRFTQVSDDTVVELLCDTSRVAQ